MQALNFLLAFVAVLALFGVAAWLIRRFAGNRLGASTNRGRMPRLAVIDAAAVDGRRRLVLVRRDNIEHLLMIGGPSDIVVESNIVRASPAREPLPQRAGVPGIAAPEPPRAVPLPDAAWSEAEPARGESVDHHEPQMPEPPPRPARPSFAEELRRPASSPERRSEPLSGFAPEPPGGRPEPRVEPRAEPRTEPVLPRMPSRSEPLMPRPTRSNEAPKPPPLRAAERAAASPPPPPAPPPTPPSADQNLAEMAQRLEAALRRPASAPPASDSAPPVAPEPPRERANQRNEPPVPPQAPTGSPKSSFENLEDEMASLLGRPKSSSS
jgi:flagellar protein FliO/FliZ